MRYFKVVRGCKWEDFSAYGMEGQVLGEDRLAAKGKPLPKEVLAHFVLKGNLAACDEEGNLLEE